MTKTTSQFRYRINPDVALTFQIRAPVQPAPVQPAEPPRPRGRPRKVSADADPNAKYHKEDEEHDGMIDVDNNEYTEDVDMEVFEAENAEGCELSVVLSVEQDEVDNVNHINCYGEIPADANLQIGGGVDDMDALHDDNDDDADELTLVRDSEDDAVQHERPQVGMKTIPESYYDDNDLVTDIEDVTLDSFDLEEEFADAGKSIDPEDLEDVEGEELLDAPAEYPVTPAGQSSDYTANEHHAGTEIVFTGESDSLDGLFTDDEENDLDASDFEDENVSAEESIIVLTKFSDHTVQHPHVDIQTDETAGSSLEQDDANTSARGNYARPFYPVLSPIPESPATMPKARPSPSLAAIVAHARFPSKPGPSITETVIKAPTKRKRSADQSDYEEIFEQGKAIGIQSRRLSKRQRVDDERTQDVSEQKGPRAITSSSGPRSTSSIDPLPVGGYPPNATDKAPADKGK